MPSLLSENTVNSEISVNWVVLECWLYLIVFNFFWKFVSYVRCWQKCVFNHTQNWVYYFRVNFHASVKICHVRVQLLLMHPPTTKVTVGYCAVWSEMIARSQATCRTRDTEARLLALSPGMIRLITWPQERHLTSCVSPPSARGAGGDKGQALVASRCDLDFGVSMWEPLIKSSVWTQCWTLSEKRHCCNPESL